MAYSSNQLFFAQYKDISIKPLICRLSVLAWRLVANLFIASKSSRVNWEWFAWIG